MDGIAVTVGLDAVHAVLLPVHVAAGRVGLFVAVPVLTARKRRGVHTVLGRVYAVAVAVLCLTAFALVAYDPAEPWGPERYRTSPIVR